MDITVDGLRRDAARLNELDRAVTEASRRRHESRAAEVAWSATAAEFDATLRRFYEPIWRATDRIRSGDASACEPLVCFLEADPWCHRSGYEKADVMRRLANHGRLLSARQRARLREVVILRIVRPGPRLTPPAARLAAEVWDDGLHRRIEDLRSSGDETLARRSERVLALATNQLRTEHRWVH